jgi:hypothetical protein
MEVWMPQPSQFTTIVNATPGQLEADEFMAVHGRPHPRLRHLQLGYTFEVRDVVHGVTVEAGREDDEQDAEDQAQLALERARDRDAARLLQEQGLG